MRAVTIVAELVILVVLGRPAADSLEAPPGRANLPETEASAKNRRRDGGQTAA